MVLVSNYLSVTLHPHPHPEGLGRTGGGGAGRPLDWPLSRPSDLDSAEWGGGGSSLGFEPKWRTGQNQQNHRGRSVHSNTCLEPIPPGFKFTLAGGSRISEVHLGQRSKVPESCLPSTYNSSTDSNSGAFTEHLRGTGQ